MGNAGVSLLQIPVTTSTLQPLSEAKLENMQYANVYMLSVAHNSN